MSYKRNQIEEAIARIVDPNCEEPPSELRTRIKRLLDLDRSIGRKPRSKDAEEANFGFFSEEAPGTGADIMFSEYERLRTIKWTEDHGARLATELRSFNHAPRPSRSRKGTRADTPARPRQTIRLGSDTRKSPPRRYRSRQYGSGISYHCFEGATRAGRSADSPVIGCVPWMGRRSANSVAMSVPRA